MINSSPLDGRIFPRIFLNTFNMNIYVLIKSMACALS